MCGEQGAWVPPGHRGPGRDHDRYWPDGVHPPSSGLQADGNQTQAETPRLLGLDGQLASRRVHRVGFQPRMVVE